VPVNHQFLGRFSSSHHEQFADCAPTAARNRVKKRRPLDCSRTFQQRNGFLSMPLSHTDHHASRSCRVAAGPPNSGRHGIGHLERSRPAATVHALAEHCVSLPLLLCIMMILGLFAFVSTSHRNISRITCRYHRPKGVFAIIIIIVSVPIFSVHAFFACSARLKRGPWSSHIGHDPYLGLDGCSTRRLLFRRRSGRFSGADRVTMN
jgi:hypothetical protein